MPNTSLGITYPASTDHDRIWEHIQEVASDVDGLLVAAPGTWTNYTPTWASSGTAPAIGNGTLSGRYLQAPNSKTVHAVVKLLAGSTTTFGTGGYTFSLPVSAATNVDRAGSAYMRDASAGGSGHYTGVVTIGTGTPTVFAAFEGSAHAQLAATTPVTWVNTDFWVFSLTYEAA